MLPFNCRWPAQSHRLAATDNSQGRVEVHDNRSLIQPRLWLVGYGDWTGLASATLIGVTRTARNVVKEIQQYLAQEIA